MICSEKIIKQLTILEGAQTRTLNLSINRPITSQLSQPHSQVLIPVMM